MSDFDVIAEEQGWNGITMLSICRDFIASRGLSDALGEHAAGVAGEENSSAVTYCGPCPVKFCTLALVQSGIHLSPMCPLHGAPLMPEAEPRWISTCGHYDPMLGPCVCGDAANHQPGGKFHQGGES